MTLEDFEKSLLQANGDDGNHEISSFSEKHSKRRKHHHRNHDMDDDRRYHRERSRHSRKDNGLNEKTQSRNSKETENRKAIGSLQQEEEWIEKDIHPMRAADSDDTLGPSITKDKLRRDSWMENPTSLDIEFKHRYPGSYSEPKIVESSSSKFDLRIHANELNKSHLQNLADGKDVKEDYTDDSARPAPADYIFGDSGSQWRMTKLKAVFKEAEETGTSVEQIAIERFGDLKAFDDLKEEQIELERRDTYGQDYVRKDKPSGGLHQERQAFKGFSGELVTSSGNEQPKDHDGVQFEQEEKPQGAYIPVDHTALNKMKAQLMRAKLRGSADASSLEKEYATAMSTLENHQEAEVIVLGAMQSRMIDGARKSEVEDTDHKRGRVKALEEVDEDMSIEDMIQEERRTHHQAGGDGQRFAERIAKDGKFDVIRNFFF